MRATRLPIDEGRLVSWLEHRFRLKSKTRERERERERVRDNQSAYLRRLVRLPIEEGMLVSLLQPRCKLRRELEQFFGNLSIEKSMSMRYVDYEFLENNHSSQRETKTFTHWTRL